MSLVARGMLALGGAAAAALVARDAPGFGVVQGMPALLAAAAILAAAGPVGRR